MAVKSSLDLDQDPRSIIGIREFDAPRDRAIKEYGADKGLTQTMARLADYVAAQGSGTSCTFFSAGL
jgi:hypothetical protein